MIQLNPEQIDAALQKTELKSGLEKYLWIQTQAEGPDEFWMSAEFRKKFNGFYRVRRSEEWQQHFYGLMAHARQDGLGFADILRRLYQATSQHEASFASKLYATLNPGAPVIDAVVLHNLQIKGPLATDSHQGSEWVKLHTSLTLQFEQYMKTANGRYLVNRFRKLYPEAKVTEMKMLDLVLWQTRA